MTAGRRAGNVRLELGFVAIHTPRCGVSNSLKRRHPCPFCGSPDSLRLRSAGLGLVFKLLLLNHYRCARCGRRFATLKRNTDGYLRRRPDRCCSPDCHRAWMRALQTGPRGSGWKSGRASRDNRLAYMAAWKAIRRGELGLAPGRASGNCSRTPPCADYSYSGDAGPRVQPRYSTNK